MVINMRRKLLGALLSLALLLSLVPAAQAKTVPTGQTVGTVLFYVTDKAGDRVLVSQIPVPEMVSDLKAGKVDSTLHNYSILDRYVTTVHQEAEGFTIPEFVTYAQGKSTQSALRALKLTFAGQDAIRLWEIDQTGFDDLDTYTYDALYGVAHYNYPMLYKYWDYRTQDYADPDGELTRDQAMNQILQSAEPEIPLLSVIAFSQRYMITDGKYGSGDYNMENLWQTSGLLDSERTLRFMKPMTKEDLTNKTSTAADSRYWVANLLLNMTDAPEVTAAGTVSTPTAVMTENGPNYYVRFSCPTQGAAIYYNHNFISPSYTPTCRYTGDAVVIPKSNFPGGAVTMTCRAVKDGYTDAGVQTLMLTSSGTEKGWSSPYADVTSGAWCFDAVGYVTRKGIMGGTAKTAFSPNAPMTRSALALALYHMAGSPKVSSKTAFADVSSGAPYAAAVAWTSQTGVVNGTTATSFSPGANITREQLAAMFYRYAKNVAKTDLTVSKDLSGYTDAAAVGSWAADGLSWTVGAGLVNGTSATALSPKGTATRAQAATMLQRLGNWIG